MKQRADHRGALRPALMTVCLIVSSLFGCSSSTFVPGIGRPLAAQTRSTLVAAAARAHGVAPQLIEAVIRAESHGDPSAISRAGAQGIMQLMPATSLAYGVANPFDPAQNIDAGTHYLHDLLTRYHGNLALAVAAYNAGPGAVDAAHGIPAFAETRAYVARVSAALLRK